ncbi:hypothetical protein [Thalassotalea sp. SU-HH00458]|uniref:hypothetical protein n=1 Tax=Thalassotalea sp. SU-HH00458 TaxID=3127657 RepID=UPI0031052CA4
MFKYWSLKKYGTKLLPYLEKRFGKRDFYSASEIRTIVYQQDFNPKYLPLGYILFLDPKAIETTFHNEFPQLNITEYKQEILGYINKKHFQGALKVLQPAS